jgi:hypothetical protein
MTSRRARSPGAVGKEHIGALTDVRAWLARMGEQNTLQYGVVDDLIERIEEYTKAGAIVRVRIKNQGDKPRAKRAQAAPPKGPRAVTARDDWWTAEELERLERLWRQGTTAANIGNLMERSESAVNAQLVRHKLFGVKRAAPGPRTVRYNTGGALTRAKQVMAERKRREREGAAA